VELKQAQYLFKQFFPGKKVHQIQAITEGLINQTFLVSTANQKFILQSINAAVFPLYKEGLFNILLVKKHLFKAKFPYAFPTPIQDKYIESKSKIWRLFPFIENSVCYNKVPSYAIVQEAGKCLGSFYRSTASVPVEQLYITLPDFHAGAFRLAQFEQAVHTSGKERKQLAQELIENIDSQKEVLLQFDQLNALLPQRVVHFDTKISNFLFNKKTDKATALIDLDTLMPGTVLSDVGDMIRTYSNVLGEESQEINQVKADAKIIEVLLRSFLSEATLTKEEKIQLYFAGKAITLMQSHRFLTDFLNDDVYYKTSYEMHNLMRAQNQWALYKSLKQLVLPNLHENELAL
tara:strand:+ start:9483 stop:10526 length:1044 start_codon:yes stop_codon:yes gene_type:complete